MTKHDDDLHNRAARRIRAKPQADNHDPAAEAIARRLAAIEAEASEGQEEQDSSPNDSAFRLESTPPPVAEAARRMHRVPGKVDKPGLRIIERAVCRHLALSAFAEDETDESSGQAIAAICRAYLLHEREQRKGAP